MTGRQVTPDVTSPDFEFIGALRRPSRVMLRLAHRVRTAVAA